MTNFEAVARLNEALAAEYIRQSGKATHTNTCSTSLAPAMQPGPCDCDAEDDMTGMGDG